MKRQKPRTLQIGEISNGTLNPEDLIPSYLWELERLRLNREERAFVRKIRKASEQEGYYDGNGEDGSADLVEDLATLSDIMDNHVPPYAYFGSIEGDGACIGVWPALDSLQRNIEDFDAEAEVLETR